MHADLARSGASTIATQAINGFKVLADEGNTINVNSFSFSFPIQLRRVQWRLLG